MDSFFSKSKRVSQPLDDQVKARLIGVPQLSGSSGSDHSSADDDIDDAPCLSELVHGFLEEDDNPMTLSNADCEFDSDRVDSVKHHADAVETILKTKLHNAIAGNFNSSRILTHVLKAMDKFSSSRSDKSNLSRQVMSYLREIGYNAAVCTTKWESSGGLTAGSYEYIDVQATASRHIIDLDFVSEFEIARPTSAYTRLIQSLPRVFVGRSEELKTILKLMCDEAKRSLKSRELLLPPWRKNRYMQSKWFGPCRRTVNSIPTVTATPKAVPKVNGAIHCRSVGFDVGSNSSLFVRTR
ncbi:uncharacterized protein [Rutidosis leptorrhynchoides]|uniref:uncharacterized protein n=1 Tax=Rutidosis leptorrhynchoides TaxID=125765 RepID=UPI003A99A27F